MGPGQKYLLGPAAPVQHLQIEPASLPETYGTRTLLLAPRDPHWLYAHWDIAPQEQRRYSAMAVGRHLVLRVYERAISGPPAAEIHLRPDARHWWVYVPRAETQYVADLGYLLPGGLWENLATSEIVATPPDTVSQDTKVQFATIEPLTPPPAAGGTPPSGGSTVATTEPLAPPPAAGGTPPPDGGSTVAATELLVPAPAARGTPPSGGTSMVATAERLAEAPTLDLPASPPHPQPRLRPVPTPPAASQAAALAQIVANAPLCQPVPGSADIAQLLEAQAGLQLGPQAVAESAFPSLAGVFAGISSPSAHPSMGQAPADAGGQPPKDFWLNVNAELVLYGATEPDAHVAIGGQPIRLRPDGTFSYRLALPDGNYDVAVTAVSADYEYRQVTLHFSRRTDSPAFTPP